MTDLPTATGKRWRPVRSGLVNLFKYENEEFRFADGRLLLRGNNGAGKSRVLALQLPFLLDGEISPRRVEPDGDPAKRMDWNLLMGRHDSRLGYTWIEFGRIDDSGTPVYLSLICGLHARKHAELKRWFAITELRIGHDLELFSDQQLPLTKDRLAVALGDRGRVIERPREYRAEVDKALFQLGDRYEPLIELLIQLRKPQLMRALDEKWLSQILSNALRPLSEGLIEDVAASFRGIEEDRESTKDVRAAHQNVVDFVRTYRRYASIAVRRQAKDVREENSQYEHRNREIKRFNEQLESKRGELSRQEKELG